MTSNILREIQKEEKSLRSDVKNGPNQACVHLSIFRAEQRVLSDEHLNFFEPMIKELAKENARLDHEITLMVEASNGFYGRWQEMSRNSKNGRSCSSKSDISWKDIFDEEIMKARNSVTSEFDPIQHPYYQQIMQNLGIENDGGDSDIEVEGQSRSENDLKCPFTGILFEEPVRSIVCKHTYSKEAVLNYIRNRSRNRGHVMCPVAACNRPLKEIDLEEDQVMSARIRLQLEVARESQMAVKSKDMDVEDEDDENSTVYRVRGKT